MLQAHGPGAIKSIRPFGVLQSAIHAQLIRCGFTRSASIRDHSFFSSGLNTPVREAVKFTPRTNQHVSVTTSTSRTKADPREPRNKIYQVNATGQKSSCTIKSTTGHVLHTDVPRTMGGTDNAPQPVEHVLAALCGCAQATATYVSRMMTPRINIDHIDFNVCATRDEKGAIELPIDVIPEVSSRIHTVEGTASVFLKNNKVASAEELQLLGTQVEARCPVANMLEASGCHLKIDWVGGRL